MPERIAIAALVRDGRVLLAHRHPRRLWYPDCWDLLGGHIEPGESPQAAVVRECREEVAVDVTEMERVDIDEVVDPDLEPHAFVVTGWTGEPTNAAPEEHDALGWFDVTSLPVLRLADPSYPGWLERIVRSHCRPRT